MARLPVNRELRASGRRHRRVRAGCGLVVVPPLLCLRLAPPAALDFISGQIPVGPSTRELVDDDIGTQPHRVMHNLEAILDAADAAFENVARMTVYLTDLKDFVGMNAVYERYVGSPGPARSTVQVAGLPKGSRVEIDAIAVLP